MLDDDDLELFAIAGTPSGGGCLGGIVSIVLIGVLWYFVHQNHEECAQKHCASPHAVPTLQNHACQCVEAPLP